MIPKIVILGRPNVGKSSLLNALAGRLISIVDPTPGVTRDRITTLARLPGRTRRHPEIQVELIDTGGYGIAPPEDPQGLRTQIEGQIARAVTEAAVILLVVDAQSGIVALDEQVAQWLRQMQGGSKLPVLVVANKVDSERLEAGGYDAARLGFGDPVFMSALNNYNKGELLDALREKLEEQDAAVKAAAEAVDEEDRGEKRGGRGKRQKRDRAAEAAEQAEAEGKPTAAERADADAIRIAPKPPGETAAQTEGRPDFGVLVAIVGKRNAGKSTLVNALAGEERMIVSELEGTTRDAVDVRFEFEGHVFTAIDTAGVRKTKSLKGDVEFYSQHRALRSVRRADVVLLLFDATLPVSQVDQQLSMEMQRHYKPTVIVVNKWDLVREQKAPEEYMDYLTQELKGLDYAPVAFVSAKEGSGTRDVMAMALNLYRQAGHRVGTSELNDVFGQIVAERPPSSGIGRRPKIYYVSQPEVRPPTIVLMVNDPSMFSPMYQRFLLNRLREKLPYSEVPIKLEIRGKVRAGGPRKGAAKAVDGMEKGRPARGHSVGPKARMKRRPKR